MINDISKDVDQALARLRVKCGDTRTSEQIEMDVEKRYYYTPQEADALIRGIESSPFHFFRGENRIYTKEEEIARVRRRVRF